MKLASDGNPATTGDAAVYYCGADGKRYVFPNAGTYFSWYKDFSDVRIVSGPALAATPLGGIVTYRPGSRMLKFATDPRTYAVAKGGVLRWIMDEAVARALYGAGWNELISDLPVELFDGGYSIGDAIGMSEVIPSPPVAACSTATTFTQYLAFGSTASQVLPLQRLLQCLDDFPADIAPTGYFGSVTQDAVKRFQTANGISPVGYVGPMTREALNRYASP
jgi:N-acetylmuramoyl-L-alanine amidase